MSRTDGGRRDVTTVRSGSEVAASLTVPASDSPANLGQITASSREDSPIWWLRWIPVIVIALLALQLLYVIGRVAIVPVLASFAIAYLLNPMVFGLTKRGMSRPAAALVSLLAVGITATSVLGFIIPELWRETMTAGERLTTSVTTERVGEYRATLRTYSPVVDKLVGARIEQWVRDPASVVGNSATWLAGTLTGVLSTAAASLDFLLVPFFVFYILVDFAKWRASFEELIPPRFGMTFQRLFDEVGRILESYVVGQLLVACAMAALYAIGFWLLSVPAWGGIALISGLLNAIPYVGTLVGLLLATGFTLADGGELWRVAGVLGVFVVVQNIEGFFLTPRILGGRLQLHPMAVFLGLLIGGNLFGLLGILLAVPMIAVGKVFAKFIRELYLHSSFYRRDAGPMASTQRESLPDTMAEAADVVLEKQGRANRGDELLSPEPSTDDPAARARAG
jgi:predicted PurR-regulated permease PerM